MMGKKKLSEIKAELGLSPAGARGKVIKARPATNADAKVLEETLKKVLAELKDEVRKIRKPKPRRRPAKR